MVSSPTRKSLLCLGLTGLSLSLLGCPDTEGEFDAFGERYREIYGEGTGTGYPTCTAAEIPAAGEVDGEYLFTFSAKLSPTQPVMFHLTMTTAEGANGLELSWTMQPIHAGDRTSLVGTPADYGPYAVNPEDGVFDAPLGELRIPGDGNPFSDNELVADATMQGSLCPPTDFFCGVVTGLVTAPITYDLEGSTFTFESVPGQGQYPEPPQVNCDGVLAQPL